MEIKLGGQLITLLHYGMRVWNKSHYGSLHFYGHSHDHLPGDRQCCDVGFDNKTWSMRPAKLDAILMHLATLPERAAAFDRATEDGAA